MGKIIKAIYVNLINEDIGWDETKLTKNKTYKRGKIIKVIYDNLIYEDIGWDETK